METTTIQYLQSAIASLNEAIQQIESNSLKDNEEIKKQARELDSACDDFNFSL